MGTLPVVPERGGHPTVVTPAGSGELRCRCPLQGVPGTLGVVPSPDGGISGLPDPLDPRPGSFRFPSQPKAPTVLCQISGDRGAGGGRPRPRLVSPRRVRIPTVRPCRQGTREGNGSGVQDTPRRSFLAVPGVVPPPPGAPSRFPFNPSALRGPPNSPSGEEPPSAPRSAPFDCMESFREALRQEGFSEKAAALAARGRRPSTRRMYSSRFRLFGEWCRSHKISPLTAPIPVIGDFLTHLFETGRQVNTVRGFRSAIAALHTASDGTSDSDAVSQSRSLNQLMRAMTQERPRVRTLAPAWDMRKVLDSLAKPPFEPMSSCSLMDLSVKTAFLIAAASARRRSALHALTVIPDHMRFEPHGVRMIPDPTFLTKTQTADFIPSPIFLASVSSVSSIEEDRFWCPVRALKYYLSRTRPLRGDCSSLFVTSRRPHGRASKDTISRWIVQAIIRAYPRGLPGRAPRAHDVRSLSSSWALFRGVPLEEILQAAGWKTPNTFISVYLKDVLLDEARMSSAFRASRRETPGPSNQSGQTRR